MVVAAGAGQASGKGTQRAALLSASRSTLFFGISGTLELKRELLFEAASLDLCQCQVKRLFRELFKREDFFFSFLLELFSFLRMYLPSIL